MKTTFLPAVRNMLVGIVLACLLDTSVIAAEERPQAVIDPTADGKLSEEEVAIVKRTVAKDLSRVQERLMERMEMDLKDDGKAVPVAVMLMKDRELKNVVVDDAENLRDPKLIIKAYRGAIRSVARHGQILAASISYVTKLDNTENTLAVLSEYEHRLGVAGRRLVGFRVENNEVAFGRPMEASKPFQWFYSEREQKQ